MHKVKTFITSSRYSLLVALTLLSLLLTSCGDDRGGVIVDASGEQGGGTQPGGGGFAFSILFGVVALSALGMFAMDRIKKSKSDTDDKE